VSEATTSDPASSGQAAAAIAAGKVGKDERLAHRGPFQRILGQPEIGAVIGAVAVWAFFWAVTKNFGTAGGTQGILDVSATLGIMAVAVSLLMIGGEFDLSAGAMTGATGILVIILVKDVGELGGAGLNLWIALPISFVVALGVGWFNGTMVERTALPSFIVTLATFFILKGVKLGFGKLIVGQIQVGRIDEGAGYDFWAKIFAATRGRNDHQWDSRDIFYVQLVLLGITLLVVSIFELNFRRKSGAFNPTGLAVMVGGIAAAIVGYILLHNTDGVGVNFVYGALVGAGILAGFVGLCLWRYDALPERGTLIMTPEVIKPLGAGLGAAVLAVIFARLFNSNSQDTIVLLLTEQGLRALLFVGLAVASFLLLGIAAFRAGLTSPLTRSAVLLAAAGIITWLAFMVRVESTSVKFRTELFTVMLVGALLLVTWAVCSLIADQRVAPDRAADRFGGMIAAVGGVLITLGIVVRLLWTTSDEIEAGLAPAQYSVRILWFLGVAAFATWLLRSTKFGGWTFAVGGNKIAARQVGVPAARTKTQLFMIVSAAAWLVGMLLAFRLNTLQAGTGDGQEFEYIIAAVVGGNLLTGGYGSAFGAAIGALIMAMSKQGIPSALWNSDWRFVFLGVILLSAVIGNNFIKNTADNLRKG
jgi:simple sugar transport system permease protein